MTKFRFIITTYRAVTKEAPDLETARKELFTEVLDWHQKQNDPDITFNLSEGIDIEKYKEKNEKRRRKT